MENANLIIPIAMCRLNLQMIQDYLGVPFAQEPSALMGRLNELSSLLGTSAQTMSSIKFIALDAVGLATQEAFRLKYPPSMAKAYAEGKCAEIIANSELANRQNAAITHQIEAVRSILSFTKQELYHSNTQR